MKKLLFGALLSFCVLAFAACGDDDDACQTCTLNVLGIESVTELCPAGDGVDVTSTVAGVSAGTVNVPNTTVAEQVQAQEAGGASCN